MIMQHLQRHEVSVGNYYVSNSKPLILEASLGTCVGVALYDQKNGIGGLSHLMLEKPPVFPGDFKPEKYASTGLPIFFDALLDAGASPENLIAAIAGGSLIGPLKEYDLDFDIGGRTVECVMEFLAKKRIPLNISETGGFFACFLNLNLQTWACTIKPAGHVKLAAPGRSQIPTAKEINRSIRNLQPIPQVALKMLRLINEDNYDTHKLTTEIRKDQVIAARTINLCNSVFYGSPNEIETVDHALVYLGQNRLIKFVISASLKTFFSQAGMGYSLCKGGIYNHALGTAIIAEKLAQATEKVSPTLAYTGGLLHDIGKVVLDQFIQAVFPLFYRNVYEEKKDSLDVEKATFGTDHTRAGDALAEQYSLPDSLRETINHHHKPEDAAYNKDLVHHVYLADLLMSRFHTGLEVERINTDALSERLETIGFSIKLFSEIVDMIPIKVLQSSPEMALMGD